MGVISAREYVNNVRICSATLENRVTHIAEEFVLVDSSREEKAILHITGEGCANIEFFDVL